MLGRAGMSRANAPLAGPWFTAVSTGDRFGCGLTTEGEVACWGGGSYGQASPPTEGILVAIDSGELGTCGLTQDGTPVCWGHHWRPGTSTPGTTLPRRSP